MANYLLLGTAAPSWLLAVTEDLTTLPSRWQAAFEANEPLTVQVVTADTLQVRALWVNPRATSWYHVVEVADPDA